MGPFVIGILLGKKLCRFKSEKKTAIIKSSIKRVNNLVKLKRKYFQLNQNLYRLFQLNSSTVCWAISVLTLAMMLLANWSTDSGIYPMDRIQRSLFEASSRILWSGAMAFIIYDCITSRDKGIINSILSWSVWVPFSKLSFCAYLIQTLVENAFHFSQHHLFTTQSWAEFVISFYCYYLVVYKKIGNFIKK